MRHPFVTILLSLALAAMQTLLAVMPRDGVWVCMGADESCACLSAAIRPTAPVIPECQSGCCSEAAPVRDNTTPTEPCRNSCDCGCIDVFVQDQVVRVECVRDEAVQTPVQLAAGEVAVLEQWSPVANVRRAPSRNGPPVGGPPPGLRTTRLLI